MTVQRVKKGLRRCASIPVTVCALLVALSLVLPAGASAESWRDDLPAGKNYRLDGSLELSYDRGWSQVTPAIDRLGETLNLNFLSFVSSPKLLSYNITGLLSHQSGSGMNSSTDMGIGFNATLLRSLPPGWSGASIYIPHPLSLRFNHTEGTDSAYTAYGFSLIQSVPRGKLLVVTEVKEDEREKDADLYEEGPSRTVTTAERKSAPFPVTMLDYDHYDLKSGNSSSSTDIYSLRSTLTGDFYNYQFLLQHENENSTGSTDFKSTHVELRPDYRFYDEETKGLFDSRNLLSYQATLGVNNAALSSGLSWSRPIGKDRLSLTGLMSYSATSGAGESVKDYGATASGAYTKYISPRLTNAVSLAAGITKTNSSDNHSVRLADSVSAVISRIFNASAGASGGESGAGVDYGANLLLNMHTRITATLGYLYDSSSAQNQPGTEPTIQRSNGRRSSHHLNLNSGGPLLNNLTFLASAAYSLVDISKSEAPRTEKNFTTSGSLYWSLPGTAVTFGANYSSTTTEEHAGTNSAASTSLFATVSRNLTRRTFFNLYSAWTSDSMGLTTLEIKPQLSWTRGPTSLNVEYDYLRSVPSGSPAVDNHRIFISLRRSFGFIR